MGKYCKFEREVYQVSYDNGTIYYNVVPEQTRKGELIERNSTDCGYEIEPIYRWYRAPATDYLCDGCPEYQERWVNSGNSFCVDVDKHQLQVKEKSYDNGETWISTNKIRDIVEYRSEDCGYITGMADYFAFEVLETGYFEFNNTIDYSLDSGSTWTTLRYTGDQHTPILHSGDTIMWRANYSGYTNGVGRFTSTCNFNVKGNIMSLLYGNNFSGQTSLSEKNSIFKNLFGQNTKIKSAENLLLPATTLINNAYLGMFSGCTNLTTAPQILPATTLANYCYAGMFNGCTSLTATPSLPATTLAIYCYVSMFQGCTSLTTTPSLPATTLIYSCYDSMFKGCTALTTAPTLSATSLAYYCYREMFSGCSSLNYIKCLAGTYYSDNTSNWVVGVASSGTFIGNASANWPIGDSGIPTGWITNISERWVDSGTTCSGNSGYDLYNLQVKEISNDSGQTWSATSETRLGSLIEANSEDCGAPHEYSGQYLTFVALTDSYFMLSGGSQSAQMLLYSLDSGSTWVSLGKNSWTPKVTAGKSIMWKGSLTTVSSSVGVGMFSAYTGSSFSIEGNIMSLIYGYDYGDNFKNYKSIEDYQFMGLFRGCTGLINAENLVLPSNTLRYKCYEEMFYGCRNLTTAPVLSASTLQSRCYYNMFYNCNNLSYVKCLATTLANQSTSYWLYGVSSSGTFVKDSSMTNWSSGTSGIPSNWTIEDA